MPGILRKQHAKALPLAEALRQHISDRELRGALAVLALELVNEPDHGRGVMGGRLANRECHQSTN